MNLNLADAVINLEGNSKKTKPPLSVLIEPWIKGERIISFLLVVVYHNYIACQ